MTANEAWINCLADVLSEGNRISPRGQTTRELCRHSLTFDMVRPAVLFDERRISTAFMAAEALWILNGSSLLDDLLPYAPSYGAYSDDGFRLSGAYGPKFLHQLKYVTDCLTEDPESRQAVMTLWDQNPRASKDVPCTISLQFLRRERQLHTLVMMRSSDVWLGLPYDMFSFTMMSAVVTLGLPGLDGLGKMTIVAGSRHLYQRDWEKAESLIELEAHTDCELFDMNLVQDREHLWVELDKVKRGDVNCEVPLFKQLASYGQEG